MITITEAALQHMNLPTSPIQIVQAARERMTDGTALVPGAGAKLISTLLGVQLTDKSLHEHAVGVKPSNLIDYELTVTQAVVEAVARKVGEPFDEQELLAAAHARALKFVTNPDTQYYFAKPESTVETGEVQKVVQGVDVAVAVKADGKIKKGGKETLAEALYHKYVAELNGAEYNNQAFIAILVKELGMSKAGATTYNYNMKKKHGGKIDAKKAK